MMLKTFSSSWLRACGIANASVRTKEASRLLKDSNNPARTSKILDLASCAVLHIKARAASLIFCSVRSELIVEDSAVNDWAVSLVCSSLINVLSAAQFAEDAKGRLSQMLFKHRSRVRVHLWFVAAFKHLTRRAGISLRRIGSTNEGPPWEMMEMMWAHSVHTALLLSSD